MNRAIEKAEELGHNYIGSEHVLYGLIAEGSGVAFNVLNKLGITADDYERLMQEKIGTSSPTNLTTAYFTPRTKRILQMAKLAASKLGSNYVGTEHLLMGILREADSAGARILVAAGGDLNKIYTDIMDVFGRPEYKPRPQPGAPRAQPRRAAETKTLDQYGRDLTELAAAGRMDPVIGRDREIERAIQILSRRSKNNPVLIGSPPGYVGHEEGGQLTEKVRRKPYAVVLFDEIEKAHEDVFNLLLQVMEDGQLTDSLGRKVNFRNAVVVMTSNVGAKAITDSRRSLGFAQQTGTDAGRTDAEIRSMVMSDLKKTFRPEFLNRVDEIIVFHKLTRADTRRIAQKLLGTVNRRMERAGVELRVPDAALDALSATGYDPVYGARPLRRAIQSTIADQAAGMLLDGSLRRGDVVTAQVREGKIVLTKTCERGMITP